MTTGSLTPQQLIASALGALAERKDEVDRLNVFPVPDGDTGTNMVLTMESVAEAVNRLSEDADLADVCEAVAKGSLMGARGNSGVILSQILRGLCEVLSAVDVIGPLDLSRGLQQAVKVAFQAVRKPVEGTMLTVLRDVADTAKHVAQEGASLSEMLDRLVASAEESVKRTPELLPVLAEAGVVDAGGYGLAVLLDGAVAALQGREVAIASAEATSALTVTPVDDWDDDEYLYCTEFLLRGEGLDKDSVTEWVSAAGGSELVVGDSSLLKIHVHTDDPAAVLARATSLGEVSQVHINNMREQTAERDKRLRDEAASVPSAAPSKPLAVVAVSPGPGITKIFESLGVDRVVPGGQTMNPSTAEILEAAESVDAATVIVLPNNKNIVLAAEQAADLCETRRVLVVPTDSVPKGLAALLAYDPEGDPDAVCREMVESASEVRVAEVTTAVKDSRSPVGEVKAGQVIGITEGEIRAVGADVVDVAKSVLSEIVDGAETVTILAGEDLSDDELDALAQAVTEAFPKIEVDPLRGDQPHYPVIMSAE